MIDGEHAAERGLELDDRVAAQAIKATGNGGEEQAHAFSNECSVEKRCRVLVFPCGFPSVNRRDVGGELGLLERPFQHVGVRNCDFSPRFEAHKMS